jgi:uncharacterized membrane protein YdbT with pleckstrin-like domain
MVTRYLLPHETAFITLRLHPGMLAPETATAAVALVAATAVSAVHSGPPLAKSIVWLLTLFLVFRLLSSIANWTVSYIVITRHRLLFMSGVFTRKIAASSLDDLKVMTLERSFAGRVLGYGEFRIGPDGPGQLVVDYIPYPEHLQLEINGILYPDHRDHRSEEA